MHVRRSLPIIVLLTLAACGCGGSQDRKRDRNADAEPLDAPQTFSIQDETESESNPFQAVTIGSVSSPLGKTSGAAAGDQTEASDRQSVLEALRPLQVLLGQWRGTTRKVYDGFKAVDELEWVFDFSADRDQPALVMSSEKSPYVRTARITYDTRSEQYRLTVIDAEGHTRQLVGDFSSPAQDVAGEGEGLQRTYELAFRQLVPGTADDLWQVVFDQQENDRYLMVIGKSRSFEQAFRQFDVVSTQRAGTSIASSDTDYGEKECIISQGLGTISVSYKGKTYWVCCSGCAAAFNEDPELWIAEAARRKAAEESP